MNVFNLLIYLLMSFECFIRLGERKEAAYAEAALSAADHPDVVSEYFVAAMLEANERRAPRRVLFFLV